jgi:ribosomal protein S18 acetylase RimI-like enzyme
MHGDLILLDPANPAQIRAAAELHAALLKTSAIPRLGFTFMTHFFYSLLVQDGLVGCYLYRSGDQYVGFLSFTEKPHDFMDEGKRRHFFRLSLVLAWSVLAKPSRVRVLWETLKITRRRERPPSDDSATGEFLSFGVLKEFAAKREGENGLRIPNVLFEAGIRYFRERGFRKIEWNVEKENLPAMLFYRSYGATLEKSPVAWPSDYRVTLDIGR